MEKEYESNQKAMGDTERKYKAIQEQLENIKFEQDINSDSDSDRTQKLIEEKNEIQLKLNELTAIKNAEVNQLQNELNSMRDKIKKNEQDINQKDIESEQIIKDLKDKLEEVNNAKNKTHSELELSLEENKELKEQTIVYKEKQHEMTEMIERLKKRVNTEQEQNDSDASKGSVVTTPNQSPSKKEEEDKKDKNDKTEQIQASKPEKNAFDLFDSSKSSPLKSEEIGIDEGDKKKSDDEETQSESDSDSNSNQTPIAKKADDNVVAQKAESENEDETESESKKEDKEKEKKECVEAIKSSSPPPPFPPIPDNKAPEPPSSRSSRGRSKSIRSRGRGRGRSAPRRRGRGRGGKRGRIPSSLSMATLQQSTKDQSSSSPSIKSINSTKSTPIKKEKKMHDDGLEELDASKSTTTSTSIHEDVDAPLSAQTAKENDVTMAPLKGSKVQKLQSQRGRGRGRGRKIINAPNVAAKAPMNKPSISRASRMRRGRASGLRRGAQRGRARAINRRNRRMPINQIIAKEKEQKIEDKEMENKRTETVPKNVNVEQIENKSIPKETEKEKEKISLKGRGRKRNNLKPRGSKFGGRGRGNKRGRIPKSLSMATLQQSTNDQSSSSASIKSVNSTKSTPIKTTKSTPIKKEKKMPDDKKKEKKEIKKNTKSKSWFGGIFGGNQKIKKPVYSSSEKVEYFDEKTGEKKVRHHVKLDQYNQVQAEWNEEAGRYIFNDGEPPEEEEIDDDELPSFTIKRKKENIQKIQKTQKTQKTEIVDVDNNDLRKELFEIKRENQSLKKKLNISEIHSFDELDIMQKKVMDRLDQNHRILRYLHEWTDNVPKLNHFGNGAMHTFDEIESNSSFIGISMFHLLLIIMLTLCVLFWDSNNSKNANLDIFNSTIQFLYELYLILHRFIPRSLQIYEDVIFQFAQNTMNQTTLLTQNIISAIK